MSDPEIQAEAFYKEVATSRIVWTIRDEAGIPVPVSEGVKAMPFWSSRERAELIIRNVEDYHGFHPIEIAWQDFKDKWGPGLTKDEVLAGVNWSGETASGFDMYPSDLIKYVEAAIRKSL